MKNSFLKITEVCEWTKNICKETCWWDDSVNKVVVKKRRLWKAWKKRAVSKDEHLVAKRASRHVVYAAKKVAQEKKFRCIKEHDTRIFKIAKQMKRGNQDVVREKCVLDNNDKCFLERI